MLALWRGYCLENFGCFFLYKVCKYIFNLFYFYPHPLIRLWSNMPIEFEERKFMIELIENLDSLRTGKTAVLNMGSKRINYIRSNRFMMIENGIKKIITEWDLISRMRGAN